MRYDQINKSGQFAPPPTHPHLLAIHLDPVDVSRLRQMLDDDEDKAARVLHVDRSSADVWMVTVACASTAVRAALDSAWG